MTDILIRNVPEADIARLDSLARDAGLSRADFLRHWLHETASRQALVVTRQHLLDFADAATDLLDPELERQAWS